MKSELEKQLSDRLTEKLNGNIHCPMCGARNFHLLDGFVSHPLQDDLKNYQIGGKSVPSVGVYCTNCGFISFHALGVVALEILKEAEKK